jgi:6-phosphogluconate dehydrogenase
MAKAGVSPLGLIGLGVMGRNLALNAEENGYPVVVWNRNHDVTESFVNENRGKRITGLASLEEFIYELKRPRNILLMVKAGSPVDDVIERLTPLLDKDDVLMDGGNSWFKDTQRRESALASKGLHYLGVGISGGEEGARFGPSLMPGGAPRGYESVRGMFEAIAARSDSGVCTTYVGPDGAGHFVKMVHNGIEYADMQLIAESYDILRRGAGLSASDLAGLFTEWNEGPLGSFLIEITGKIFGVTDERTGRPLVEMVLDKAGQKGTGRWTVQVALDLGVPVPSIAAALDGRMLSSLKDERVDANKQLRGPRNVRMEMPREEVVELAHDALYAAKIGAYAQGMNLIRAASDEYGWNIDLAEMARIWKGGCIIRAKFLDKVMQAYRRDAKLANLLLDAEVAGLVHHYQSAWRSAVCGAQMAGIAVPAMSCGLAYYDGYRTERLPQNLTQAQRDAFGAHTYQRSDRPQEGFLHTDWLGQD